MPDEVVQEPVILDLVDAVDRRVAVEEEERVERLAVLPGKVLFGGPVGRLEVESPGTPLDVVPQFVL